MQIVYIKHKSTPEFLHELNVDLGVNLFFLTSNLDYVGYFPEDNDATDGWSAPILDAGDEYCESKDEFFDRIRELQIEYGYRNENGELV